jgi:glycosyltransferase involved in cell wall biosynthesis
VKIIAIIPCFNEAKAIGNVVLEARKYCDRVLVVDNLSMDATKTVAKNAGAKVIKCNAKGVGCATNLGFEWGLKFGYDIFVTLDGDGQHNPNEIPLLIKKILNNEADMVVGSRYLKFDNMPLYRRIGINIVTALCNLEYKKKIMDSQSGFRAYSSQVIKEIMPIKEKGYSYIIETLLKAKSLGFRMAEVPIECIYHEKYCDNSSINPLSHGIIVFGGLFKWRFKLELIPILKRALRLK